MLKYVLGTVMMLASLFASFTKMALDYKAEVAVRGTDYTLAQFTKDKVDGIKGTFGGSHDEALAVTTVAAPTFAPVEGEAYDMVCIPSKTGGKTCRVVYSETETD